MKTYQTKLIGSQDLVKCGWMQNVSSTVFILLFGLLLMLPNVGNSQSVEDLQSQISALQNANEELAAAKAPLLEQLADAQADLAEEQAGLAASAEAFVIASGALQALESELAGLTQALADNASAMASLDPESPSYFDDSAQLASQADGILQAMAAVTFNMELQSQILADVEVAYVGFENAVNAYAQDVTNIQQQLDQIQQQIDSNNQQIEALQQQIQDLQNM